jgi:predicted RNA-binding Zn-ribbon protein involved in translation (DUF1610 family)
MIRRTVRLASTQAVLLITLAAADYSRAQEAKDEPAPPDKKYAKEDFNSLREKPADMRGFFGPGAHQFVKFEPEGMRIALPTNHPPGGTTGFATGLNLRGDFDITVRFEILKEPEPENAGAIGTRLSLMAGWERPGMNSVKVTRSMTTQGSCFLAHSRTAATNKPDLKLQPTQARTGQLRLIRSGAKLFYYASEGAKELELFHERPFIVDDLYNVRVVAAIGDPKASLEVRVTDLKIRADAFPEDVAVAMPPPVMIPQPVPPLQLEPGQRFPQPGKVAMVDEEGRVKIVDFQLQQALLQKERAVRLAVPPVQAPPAVSARRPWLIAALIIGVAIMFFFALSLLLFLLLRRRGSTHRVPAVESRPASRSTHIVFACPECGKSLKAKVELARKKVRCVHCGNAVPVLAPDRNGAIQEAEIPVV